ncbi:MAG: prepilin-type N-terminal cleavage/methylation domain-containing protein [Planctomycetes bacterium]|nr:prepilin-type N-terminal cleavage/methylation domain-containing protein [Planctomycetota bacterium]
MVNCGRQSSKRGFTLIELLVVVSIIALLISILLPAVGETRRQARISLCTANMKQHGQGVANYASANQDTLPHVPKNNNKGLNAGKGSIPGYFASRDLPVNGVTFANPGPQTAASVGAVGTVLNGSEYMGDRTLQAWNGYFIFMSEYMIDGTAGDVFNNVFLSPSDTGTIGNWKRLKTYVANGAQSGTNAANSGWWQLIGAGAALPNSGTTVPLAGSYRYVIAAMTDQKIYTFTSAGAPNTPGGGPAYNIDFGTGGSNANFQTYVKRNPVSTIDYPAQKVLFYMWFAWHNPNKNAWFEQDVVCPVALGDGSARATVPTREALPLNYGNNENAGPYFRVYFTGDQNTTVFTAYYMLTNGGLRGRDL